MTDIISATAPAQGMEGPLAGDERAQRVLEERARRLAQTEAAADSTGGDTVPVLLCRVRDERYALELGVLEAVRPAAGLVPVPCAPPFVAGILNVRGEIVSVLDLAAALGQSAGAPAEGSSVLLLQVAASALGQEDLAGAATAAADVVRLGLLVDEVLDVEAIAGGDLIPPLSGKDYARSVAGTAIVLLDVERLLASSHFDVAEDVT